MNQRNWKVEKHVYENVLLIKTGTVYINPSDWNHLCRQVHKNVAQNGIVRRPGKLCSGRVPRISSEGDDRRTFLGLKFSISGFFMGRSVLRIKFDQTC